MSTSNNDPSHYHSLGLLISCWTGLHLYLTSREGLILHDDSAAARQDHDVELLLLVVGLLVPLPHHISVMGWNQSDLTQERRKVSELKHSENSSIILTTKMIFVFLSLLPFQCLHAELSSITSGFSQMATDMPNTYSMVLWLLLQYHIIIYNCHINTWHSPAYCFPTGPFLPAEHQGQPYWAPELSDHCHWPHSKRSAPA